MLHSAAADEGHDFQLITGGEDGCSVFRARHHLGIPLDGDIFGRHFQRGQ